MGLKEPLVCTGTAMCMLGGVWVALVGVVIHWRKKCNDYCHIKLVTSNLIGCYNYATGYSKKEEYLCFVLF